MSGRPLVGGERTPNGRCRWSVDIMAGRMGRRTVCGWRTRLTLAAVRACITDPLQYTKQNNYICFSLFLCSHCVQCLANNKRTESKHIHADGRRCARHVSHRVKASSSSDCNWKCRTENYSSDFCENEYRSIGSMTSSSWPLSVPWPLLLSNCLEINKLFAFVLLVFAAASLD